MKKIIFTLAMFIAVSLTAGAEEKTTKNVGELENVEAYDIKVNINSLVRFLDLNRAQAVKVEEIQNIFTDCMKSAGNMDEESRKRLVKNALNYDLKQMKMFLNDKQYKKYVIVLNTTLINRGIDF